MQKKTTSILLIFILFIVLIALPTFTLFVTHYDKYMLCGDLNNFLYPKKNLGNFNYFWAENSGSGFGSFWIGYIFELPHLFLNYIQYYIGIPNLLFEKIDYIIYIIIAFFGCNKLLSFYFNQKIENHYIAMISLFYIFNIYFLINFHIPIYPFLAFWAFLPWIFFTFSNFLRKLDVKSFLFFVLINLSGIGSITNLAFLPILFFLFLTIIIIERKHWLTYKEKILKYFLILFLINLFWLLPFYSFATQQKEVIINSSVSQIKSAGDLENSARYSNILNTFSLIGTWDFFNDIDNKPSIDFSVYYKNFLWIFSVILIPVFIILFNQKNTRLDIYIIIFYLSLIYIITVGLNTETFKKFILDYNLLFFRNTYTKFGFILLFLYLFILARSFILNKKITIIFLIFYIMFSSIPFLNGTFINQSCFNEYHPDYYQLSDFLNTDKTLNQIVKLPFPTYLYIGERGKDWNYWGTYFMYNFVDNNVIEIGSHFNNIYVDNKLKQFSLIDSDSNAFLSSLNELGIKYVILNNYFYDPLDQNNAATKLEKYKKLMERNYQDGHFIEVYSGNLFTVFKYTGLKSKKINSKDIFFQKINPTKYKLYIKDVKSVQDLSFLESFHNEWNLYLEPNPTNSWCKKLEFYESSKITECEHVQKFFEGEELSYLWEKPIFDSSHKVVNEYANGWTIDPEYIKANYPYEYYRRYIDGSIDIELTLYFKPQSYFYIGIIISTLTFVGCIGYLAWDWRRKRNGQDSFER